MQLRIERHLFITALDGKRNILTLLHPQTIPWFCNSLQLEVYRFDLFFSAGRKGIGHHDHGPGLILVSLGDLSSLSHYRGSHIGNCTVCAEFIAALGFHPQLHLIDMVFYEMIGAFQKPSCRLIVPVQGIKLRAGCVYSSRNRDLTSRIWCRHIDDGDGTDLCGCVGTYRHKAANQRERQSHCESFLHSIRSFLSPFLTDKGFCDKLRLPLFYNLSHPFSPPLRVARCGFLKKSVGNFL